MLVTFCIYIASMSFIFLVKDDQEEQKAET